MPYCTVAQVRAAVPSARVGQSSTWTDAIITEWIAEADAIIDGRLAAARVDPERLPLQADDMLMLSVAARLRRISTALVAYRLMRALPGSQTFEDAEAMEATAQRELAELRADPGSVVKPAAILARGAKRFEEPES